MAAEGTSEAAVVVEMKEAVPAKSTSSQGSQASSIRSSLRSLPFVSKVNAMLADPRVRQFCHGYMLSNETAGVISILAAVSSSLFVCKFASRDAKRHLHPSAPPHTCASSLSFTVPRGPSL